MKSTAALSAFAGVILTLIASLPNTGCSPRPPRHGTSFLVLVETNQPTAPSEHEQALAEIRDVLQRRLEQTGVGRPFFQPTNEGQLRILLPPLREPAIASIRKLIERPGILEFRMVHPDSEELIKDNIILPGYEVLREQKPRSLPDGSKTFQQFLVSRTPASGMIGGKKLAMTGKFLKRALAMRDPVTSQPEIDFELDVDSTEIFRQITLEFSPKGNRFHQLAIVFDGVLYSAPRIMGEVPGGHGRITGNFTAEEAVELANILEHPLPATLRIIEVTPY